jgi:hypothetical protein
MRRLAWGLVIAGLLTGFAGELLVIFVDEQDDNLLLWQAVGIGTAIAALGLLLLVRRPLYARLLRRRNFPGLVPSTFRRLIIVARDEPALYDYIRRDQFGDETVRVITDRRSTARRLRMEAHLPDRRRGDRRRYAVEPLLLTQGWAQVTLPES